MIGYLFSFYQPNRLLILCCLGFVFLVQPLKAQPPGRILFNSDFEIPVLTPSSPSPPRQSCSPATACWYLTRESTVPGWNVVDASTVSTDIVDDNVEFWNSGFLGVPAQNGNQFIELNADRATPVFFEICMFSGETLTWSLWHRGRSGTDQMFLDVTDASNALLATQTITTGNTAWVNYTGTITNTGPNGAIRFTFRPGTTASGDATVGNFIDNIQVLGLRPLVEFASPTYSAIENTISTPRLIVNGTIPAGGATVTIAATGGTATGGAVDYSSGTTVTIPAGNYDGTLATSIPISLSIIDDLIPESSETITFSIITVTDPLLMNDTNCNGTVISNTVYTIIDNDALLPVELVSFIAKTSENIDLLWQTTSEEQSSHFEVQRSDNGFDWKTIGKVQSTNTNNLKNYSFTDKNYLPKAYYRLKMVDIDNTYAFSKVLFVNFSTTSIKPEITLYPNPVLRGEKLHIPLPTLANKIHIQIDDIVGRSYGSYSFTTKDVITITAPTIQGTYFVTIFYDDTVVKSRIIVQ